VFNKSKEYLLKELNGLSMQELEDQLPLEQFNDLNARKKIILDKIEQKPITTILD
jgi:hypothetical protein